MPFGWACPWPFQWGGGETPIESALSALQSSLGKGHMAEQDGIDWRWREARAIGLGIGLAMAERALSQFEPTYATSGIKFYRELYNLEGYEDEAVREIATDLSAEHEDFGIAVVTAALQEIDSRFSVIARTWAQADTTIHGRTFGDWNGDDPFNFRDGGNETRYPNYSNIMKFEVMLDVTGVPTDVDLLAVERAKAFLDDDLPSWVDYEIGGGVGFTLDESLLDWDRFDS